MTEISERLRVIRAHLRTGALGQREVWEEWLAEAADDNERLRGLYDSATDQAVRYADEVERLKAAIDLAHDDVERLCVDVANQNIEIQRLTAEITSLKGINSQRQKILAQEIVAHRAAKTEIERLTEQIELRAVHYGQAVADVAELRAALQFYADDCGDTGLIARRALEPKP